MVTRAMGDGYLKKTKLSQAPFKDHCPYITSTPEVHEVDVHADDAFVVLASDGIWDVLENEEVVQLIGQALSRKQQQAELAEPQQLAQLVVDAALRKVCEDNLLTRTELDRMGFGGRRRKIHDDMTVVVLCLNDFSPVKASSTVVEKGAAAAAVVPSSGSTGQMPELGGSSQTQQKQELATDLGLNIGAAGSKQGDERKLSATTNSIAASKPTPTAELLSDPSTSSTHEINGVADATPATDSVEGPAAVTAMGDDTGTKSAAESALSTDSTHSKRNATEVAAALQVTEVTLATDDGEPTAKRARGLT